MYQQNQSVAFEIEIKKIDTSPSQPAIKKKLEEGAPASPPQLETIEQKLLEARTRRAENLAKSFKIDERVRDAHERRSNLMKEFTTKTLKVGETKRETAEQRRQKVLDLVLEKAKKEGEKVFTAREKQTQDARRKKQEKTIQLEIAYLNRQKNLEGVLEKAKKTSEKLNKAQEQRTLVVKRKGEKIDTKLETAEQLRTKLINQKIEAARKFTSKIDKAKESRYKSEQDRESALKETLERVSLSCQKSQKNIEETAQKAKSHVEKIKKVAADHKEKMVRDSTTKSLEISSKLQKAEVKKQQVLQEIKDKAKQSTQMRGSSKNVNQISDSNLTTKSEE